MVGQIDLRSWEFAGPVARAYELSREPVAVIVGPTGGGKSTASARRCLRVATWQHPSPRDGVRRARIVCLCPTYRRAWDTVMPSYFKVFPQSLGTFRGARGDPADHIFDMNLTTGGELARVHVEVLFRAVQDLDLEEFFRGLEVTAFWNPEMDTNQDEAIVSLEKNRVGRYPEPDDRPENAEPAYSGIFGDANAPMMDAWFHERMYLRRRPGDRLFIQPGGFSPRAENMKNLRKIRPDYYAHMAAGLDPYDVQRLIYNRPGYGRHGQPVHPNFDQDTHVSQVPIAVDPLLEVFISVDAGSNTLHPGAVFWQRAYSQWRALDEVFLPKGQTMNNDEFAYTLRAKYEARFGGVLSRDRGALICIDPAANGRNALSEYTVGQALQHLTGIEVQLAPSNKPNFRRSALDKLFLKMAGPREPAIVIDPRCHGLIAGLAGGFHYHRRGQVVGLTPVKNEFSHIVEAAEYGPLTIDGLDASEGRFIRPDGDSSMLPPTVLMDG